MTILLAGGVVDGDADDGGADDGGEAVAVADGLGLWEAGGGDVRVGGGDDDRCDVGGGDDVDGF